MIGRRKARRITEARGSLRELAQAEVAIVDGAVLKCRYPLKGRTILVYGTAVCR